MRGMILHPELPLDDLRHAPARPHLAPKTKRLRPLGQHAWQLCPFLGAQLGLPTRCQMLTQRFDPFLPGPLEPTF